MARSPAERRGAAMPVRQLFAPGADAVLRLLIWGTFIVAVTACVMLYGYARGDYIGDNFGAGVAPEQPVPFSHKHHAGELGLDCRYCHTQVQDFATAGLPPTYTCMTCHSEIWKDSPMLAPVRDSLAKDAPLHWQRVNRLPDYVYFDHSIHIAKGVGCSSCHGAVDTMQLTYAAHSFRMEFCLSCHRAPEDFVRPASEIYNMGWTPPADQATQGAALVKAYHIHDAARLTNCSICHR